MWTLGWSFSYAVALPCIHLSIPGMSLSPQNQYVMFPSSAFPFDPEDDDDDPGLHAAVVNSAAVTAPARRRLLTRRRPRRGEARCMFTPSGRGWDFTDRSAAAGGCVGGGR